MKVAQEARDWFVRLLDDDVPAEEIAAWQGWLARSPAHREAYDRVTDAWTAGGLGSPTRASLSEIAADSYDGQTPVEAWRRRPAPSRWMRPASMAASLAAAMVAAGLVFGSQPGPAQAITTARAEHKDAALTDGSKVAVGAMTGVQVRMTPARREIRLDSGEAFFQVAKDKARPFVVSTPFGAVTAVGTAFNVDVGKHELSLNVTEGVVLVQPYLPGLPPGLRALGSKPVRVEAGQRMVVSASGLSVEAQVRAAPSGVTWRERRLEYRAEPLAAVIEDVNRYAEHPIVLRDPSLGELSYTGTVRLDATDDWAAALPAAFPLSVVRVQDGVIALSARM